jgi:hypothetical protein
MTIRRKLIPLEAAIPAHENARRLDWSSRRAPQKPSLCTNALEHAEHNGADKRNCQIRGNNAQPADQRTHEGHREISLIHIVARFNAETSKAFQAEKVSAAALLLTLKTLEPPPTWLKTRENNALMSP